MLHMNHILSWRGAAEAAGIADLHLVSMETGPEIISKHGLVSCEARNSTFCSFTDLHIATPNSSPPPYFANLERFEALLGNEKAHGNQLAQLQPDLACATNDADNIFRGPLLNKWPDCRRPSSKPIPIGRLLQRGPPSSFEIRRKGYGLLNQPSSSAEEALQSCFTQVIGNENR